MLTSLGVFGRLLWILVWANRMLNYKTASYFSRKKKESLFGITKNCNLGLQPQQTVGKSPRKKWEETHIEGKRKLGGYRERAVGEVEVVRLSCPTPL